MLPKTKLGLKMVGLFSLGLSLAGSVSHADDKKINVMASFYPMYEFTKEIVGDEGEVSMLLKAGTEIHGFSPSTKDMVNIQKADAFVYNDDNLETWIDAVKATVSDDQTNFIKATGDMLLLAGSADHDHHKHDEDDHDHDHDHEDDHDHAYDPHVWLSPERALGLVDTIADDLAEQFPDKADAFKKNATAYKHKLTDLDKEYHKALDKAKQTSFVTQHAAFSYLALDYGLKQIPITGISSDTEPSAKRLTALSKYIDKYDISYIYFEENASSKVAKTLAKEADVKTAVLNHLESLTEKQMKAGQDYFSVMRDNLKALRLTTDKAGKAIEAENGSEKTVYAGYFDDKDIKDRKLSDWSGNWQSVYPYLQDGTLDPVWEHKAKLNQEMTAADYKDYYTTGYKTDVDNIMISDNTMTFKQGGEEKTFTYKYVGYEVLTYKKGNRGVRYLFETDDANAGSFKYVQFSDHSISPTDADHFHIYFGGESQKKLLEELENWPTYYPTDLSGRQVAQEMLAH